MQNVTLKIDGMTCGGCVKSVTRVLNELDVAADVANGISHDCAIRFGDSLLQKRLGQY